MLSLKNGHRPHTIECIVTVHAHCYESYFLFFFFTKLCLSCTWLRIIVFFILPNWCLWICFTELVTKLSLCSSIWYLVAVFSFYQVFQKIYERLLVKTSPIWRSAIPATRGRSKQWSERKSKTPHLRSGRSSTPCLWQASLWR